MGPAVCDEVRLPALLGAARGQRGAGAAADRAAPPPAPPPAPACAARAARRPCVGQDLWRQYLSGLGRVLLRLCYGKWWCQDRHHHSQWNRAWSLPTQTICNVQTCLELKVPGSIYFQSDFQKGGSSQWVYIFFQVLRTIWWFLFFIIFCLEGGTLAVVVPFKFDEENILPLSVIFKQSFEIKKLCIVAKIRTPALPVPLEVQLFGNRKSGVMFIYYIQYGELRQQLAWVSSIP